jgi:uncharacterized protein
MGIPIVLVDADSCPVKEEIVEIAHQFSIKVFFVASYNHMKLDSLEADWKYVDASKEALTFIL